MSQYFSQEGLEKLKKELEERQNRIRTEINQRILSAKEQGDLSDNAEFTEAKDNQAFNEGRIVEIDDILRQAMVVGRSTNQTNVEVGSTVKVKSPKGEHTFSIVGPSESDPSKGFISNESPLGSALLGHQVGDTIEVRTPGGMVQYEIMQIM